MALVHVAIKKQKPAKVTHSFDKLHEAFLSFLTSYSTSKRLL